VRVRRGGDVGRAVRVGRRRLSRKARSRPDRGAQRRRRKRRMFARKAVGVSAARNEGWRVASAGTADSSSHRRPRVSERACASGRALSRAVAPLAISLAIIGSYDVPTRRLTRLRCRPERMGGRSSLSMRTDCGGTCADLTRRGGLRLQRRAARPLPLCGRRAPQHRRCAIPARDRCPLPLRSPGDRLGCAQFSSRK